MWAPTYCSNSVTCWWPATRNKMSVTGGKYPYVVVLKNQSVKKFSLLGILLNLASVVFFCAEFLFVKNINFFLLAGILAIIGIVAWNIWRARNGKKVFYDRAYLVTALLWIKMPYMEWLLVPFIILALLEHQVKFPLEIGFSETRVVFNTLFKRKYNWSDLSNVVLRDGLLTIDFRNNRILQREIEEDEEDDDTSEEEFNTFCREQLQKNPR
jgi:hypothetical protein